METATQLNMTIANGPGTLAKVCDVLRSANVNIEALFQTEKKETCELHLVTDDTETAKLLLQPLGTVTQTTVLVFHLQNKPGAIAQVARLCAGAQLNICEIYSSCSGKEATVYLSVNDIKRAQEVFGKGNVAMPALLMAKK